MQVADVAPALQARLGPAATAGLLELFDTVHAEWRTEVTTAAVERFERRLTEEMSSMRVSLAQSEGTLRVEMRDLRVELLKWSFAFWIGQVIATAGIMGVMVRLLGA
jgi:hypothetical protein